MSVCPQCGAGVSSADRFCGDCGASLPATAAGAGGSAAAPAGAAAAPFDLTEIMPPAAPPVGAGTAPTPTSNAAPTAAAPAAPAAAEAEPARAMTAAAGASGEAGQDASAGADDGAHSDAANDVGLEVGRDDSDSEAGSSATPPGADVLDVPAPDGGSGGASANATGSGGPPTTAADSGGAAAAPDSGSAGRRRAGTMRHDSTGRLRAPAQQLDPGTLLYSRYEIVRRIGGGGMGAVYLAKDRNLGEQPRAVKEMIQSQLDELQHEKAIGDFKRESMLLASLEHSSIPTIYDYFYDDDAGRFYLVMKYISGGDFLQRLRNAPQGRLDEKTVTDWGIQIADVLDYLHRRNPPIIYRDLKPANLMIDGNSGRVMLIDFGIARWVAPQEKGVTAVGTMGYAPPELFGGKVEPRSDIYSLGATMFHLLTGADPQDNPLLIFDFTKHPMPRQLAPALSNEMQAILMRTVEYKPEDRFRSAAELRDALAAHLEKLRTGQVTHGAPVPAGTGQKTMQVETVFCGFCGARIAADDLYCAHCGQRQPLAAASAALRTARATAKLVVMGTTELDSAYQLHKESSLVGRSDPHSNIFPEVDLSRFDPHTKVSRRHARIFRKGDVYLVEDLGSVNGTVINDSLRLAPHQPRALESGDKLRLGETTLHFLVG